MENGLDKLEIAFFVFDFAEKKWKMSEKCEKLLKYVGNALDMWDMA